MKREEILVNCIDDIQAGRLSLEECVSRYPQLADELRGLFRVLNKINNENIVPSTEFIQRTKNHLIEVMDATESERKLAKGWLHSLLPGKLSYAFTVVSILLAIGSGGTVYASQNSLPSDILYPVKTSVEKIQLAITLTPESKAYLRLKLAERRINEVLTEAAQGREISSSALQAMANEISNAVTDINKMPEDQSQNLISQLSQSTLSQQANLEQVSKEASESAQPALKQAIDVARRGNLIAEVAGGNPSFLGSGASVFDNKLESAYFEIEGTLLSVEGRTWDIGGIKLRNVNVRDTTPRIGGGVELRGMVRNNEIFISRIERQQKTLDGITIKGVFSGTNADGKIWYLAGIPVGEVNNVTLPNLGKQVEIKGVIQNGVFTVSDSSYSDKNAAKPSDSKGTPDDRSKTGDSKSTSDDKSKSGDSKNMSGDRNMSEDKSKPDGNGRSGDSKNTSDDRSRTERN